MLFSSNSLTMASSSSSFLLDTSLSMLQAFTSLASNGLMSTSFNLLIIVHVSAGIFCWLFVGEDRSTCSCSFFVYACYVAMGYYCGGSASTEWIGYTFSAVGSHSEDSIWLKSLRMLSTFCLLCCIQLIISSIFSLRCFYSSLPLSNSSFLTSRISFTQMPSIRYSYYGSFFNLSFSFFYDLPSTSTFFYKVATRIFKFLMSLLAFCSSMTVQFLLFWRAAILLLNDSIMMAVSFISCVLSSLVGSTKASSYLLKASFKHFAGFGSSTTSLFSLYAEDCEQVFSFVLLSYEMDLTDPSMKSLTSDGLASPFLKRDEQSMKLWQRYRIQF